jgi:AraC-like DNA-binding protein
MTSSQPIRPTADLRGAVLAAVALTADAPLPHRGEDHGLLFGTQRGLLSLDTGDSRWVVPPGHVAWVPPSRLRQAERHGEFGGWCVKVAESACADLPGGACTFRSSGLLHEAVLRACTWGDGPLDAVRWRLAGVILDEIRALRPAEFGLPMPLDPRLLAVAGGLLGDLAGARSLDDWAAEAAMPARTFTRNFALETGSSLADWRQRARLMRALEWLAEARPVTDMATDLGYDNVSAFIAMFRRATGVTPSRYADQPLAGSGGTP